MTCCETMLPDELAFIVVTFLDLQHNLKVTRLINKQFYNVCQYPQLWQNISFIGFKECYMQKIIEKYGSMFQSLRIKQSRFGRKSCKVISKLNNLTYLNLKKVYSNSLLDDRFCFLIRKMKIKTLILGPSSINDVGLNSLKNIGIEKLEIRHNDNISKKGIRGLAKWQRLKKLTLYSICGIIFIHRLGKVGLEELEISFCPNLQQSSLEAFCAMPNNNLRKFLLYGHYISKKMIKALSKSCPNIETFALCHARCSQTEFSSLRLLRKMKYLSIICCSPLCNFKFLRTIQLQKFFICRTKLIINPSYGFTHFVKDLKNCKLIPINNYV